MRPRQPHSESSGRWTSRRNQKHAETHGATGPRDRRRPIGTKQLRSKTGVGRYAYRCRKAFGRHQLAVSDFIHGERRSSSVRLIKAALATPKTETTEAGDGVVHQVDRPRPSPRFAAILTRSANDSAFIFCMTRPRCALTVISLIPNSPATCLLSMPVTTRVMTCCSLGDS